MGRGRVHGGGGACRPGRPIEACGTMLQLGGADANFAWGSDDSGEYLRGRGAISRARWSGRAGGASRPDALREQGTGTRQGHGGKWLKNSRLVATPGLQFDVDVDERDGGRGDAGNAGGVAKRARADFEKFFLHFAGEAADGAVVKPVGDGALLGFLEAIDGTLLLREVAGVFDFSLDGLEIVARLRGGRDALWAIVSGGFKELRSQIPQNGDELFNRNLRALEELGKRLAYGGGEVVASKVDGHRSSLVGTRAR